MKTKKLVLMALMCALTCIATMIIKIPTPTMGYIHPGDAVVLLSGFLLGPVSGGFVAGLGSCFADLFSGYLSYAPATFLIKALTAVIGGLLGKIFLKLFSKKGKNSFFCVLSLLIAGIIGEAFMVIGYFVFEIFLMTLTAGNGFSGSALLSGCIASLSGIPFNILQGLFGAIVAALIYPLIQKSFSSAIDD